MAFYILQCDLNDKYYSLSISPIQTLRTQTGYRIRTLKRTHHLYTTAISDPERVTHHPPTSLYEEWKEKQALYELSPVLKRKNKIK